MDPRNHVLGAGGGADAPTEGALWESQLDMGRLALCRYFHCYSLGAGAMLPSCSLPV